MCAIRVLVYFCFIKLWYLHCTTVNWMKKYFLKVVPRWNISPLSPGCYYIFSVYSGSTWIKMDRWSRAAVLVFHHPRTVLALMRCSNLWCWYRGNGQIRPEGGPCPQASNTPLILLLHLLRSDQNACSEWQRGWLGVFTVSRKSGGKRHRRSLKVTPASGFHRGSTAGDMKLLWVHSYWMTKQPAVHIRQAVLDPGYRNLWNHPQPVNSHNKRI